MTPFRHRAISASAGTGKTWALTHRYLALLAAGESPDRICALTFSRKAAGEIFDSIVGRLCDSAADNRQRRITADHIARQAEGVAAPEDPQTYINLLRRLLNQAHRLRVGTLDSFILGIARSFPLELGLPPDVQPMDNSGFEAQAIRQALLMRLFDPRHRDRGGQQLIEDVRQANSGKATKSLARQADTRIAETYDFYCEHFSKAWGVAESIWPDGRWWEDKPQSELDRAADPEYLERLRQAFGPDKRAVNLAENCVRIVETAALHTRDKTWPTNISEPVLEQLFDGITGGSGIPSLVYYKKEYHLPADLWPPLRAALANLLDVEVRRCLETTSGLFALLQRFNALYGETQLVEGRLSFADFARQLGHEDNRLSLNPEATDRLYIDYRMDAQLDHWLLDEFQDTSDSQWNAIANLVDEVVQDPENRRSFFYVGDIKQSIYGWRGGNYRLFGHVRTHCGIPKGDTLTVCHRSLPVIIDTVNSVFDKLDHWNPLAGSDKGPHPLAVQAFMSEWQTHESARHDEGPGFAVLLEYEPKKPVRSNSDPGDEPDNDGDPAQFEAIARILKETQPTVNGLSAAVLVRDNRQGRACTDVLRRHLDAVPVVHEGTGGILDNPVVSALLALVRYAMHPADTLALRHLQISPWAAKAAESGTLNDWIEDLPGRFMNQVHESGFAGTLRDWGNRLLEAVPIKSNDVFARQRFKEFLAAAEVFDAAGSCDGDAFEDHIRAYQVKSEAAAGAIRVMTIHQAKGLGFDLVMVPFDQSSRSFNDTSSIGLLRNDYDRALPSDDGWVLCTPRRTVLQAAGGPAAEALQGARAQENFSQLCVLYVALTRAKRALYLFTPKPPKNPGAVREADLLRERLSAKTDKPTADHCGLPALYRAGDPGWFKNVSRSTEDSNRTTVQPQPLQITFVTDASHREPSKDRAEGQPYAAAYIFDPKAGDVRYFGSAIHRLFEKIEWIEDTDLETLVSEWRATSAEPLSLLQNVENQFRNCLAQPAVRLLLSRPPNAPRAQAWRETPFHYVSLNTSGTEIITGRFDRLVVEMDRENRAVRATVVDFKSNRVTDEHAMQAAAAGYRRQMQDYAAAAARLLGLPAPVVRTTLLFTRLAMVHQDEPGFRELDGLSTKRRTG